MTDSRYRRQGRLLFTLLVAAGLLATAPAQADDFVAEQQPYTIGQAPDWLDDENVVWQDEADDGKVQTFKSTLDGQDRTCLTCGLKGPNQVPVAQPGGDWVLFHGWSGHNITLGGPGFGGMGSDVWVMRKDGSQRTNLTKNSEGYDNFHAYWSPDGSHIVWTKLNFNPLEGGTGKSDVRVARFEPDVPGGPRLASEHAVRPQNGHFYETQWWAPDGSGFLYTESVDTAVNLELFFCRLPDPDHGACEPQRLTKNPAWDEQAIFTPDMDRIIFMSTRDNPGAFNDWSFVATALGLPADLDYLGILPVFELTFLQPVLEQANDLYEITLDWNADHTRFTPRAEPPRRLTHHGPDGWIIPELAWAPDGERLLWTESKFNEALRIDHKLDIPKELADIVAALQDPSLLTTGGTGPPGAPGQPAVAQIVSRTFVASYR